MLSDLSKRVDDLQDSVSKIAEALSYLVASSSDKEEKEELAEKVGISTTHMSHIETGNTKLSLPVFVDIANALEVRTDDLLDNPATATTSTSLDEIATVLERCSAQEAKVIADVVKATKCSIDKHL